MERDIFNQLDRIHWEMERLFHSLLNPRHPLHLLADKKWKPLTDVYEMNGELCIKIELPGIKKEDISLVLEGKQIILRGTRPNPDQKSGVIYHQMEINYGDFERIIVLPVEVDEKDISAEMKDGFLNIKINLHKK